MEPRTPRLYHGGEAAAANTFTPFGAVGIVCAATATMLVGTIFAHRAGIPVMVVAVIAQAIMLAVSLGAMRGSGRTWAAIGVARPIASRHYVAGILIGASAWYLNMRLVQVLPLPDEDRRFVALIDRPSFAVVVVAVAVFPAVCEEVLFRGVLVRALATRFYAPVALLMGAMLFSLYHMRVVQIVPTFTLGIVLGYLALRANSVLPCILAHFMNNAIALVITRGDAPPVARVIAAHPHVALGAFATLLAMGVWLASGHALRKEIPP